MAISLDPKAFTALPATTPASSTQTVAATPSTAPAASSKPVAFDPSQARMAPLAHKNVVGADSKATTARAFDNPSASGSHVSNPADRLLAGLENGAEISREVKLGLRALSKPENKAVGGMATEQLGRAFLRGLEQPELPRWALALLEQQNNPKAALAMDQLLQAFA